MIISGGGAIEADLSVHVAVAIAPLRERLVAVFASVWSLTCMRSHVVKHVAKFAELFIAGEALKYLILAPSLRINDFGTLVTFLL